MVRYKDTRTMKIMTLPTIHIKIQENTGDEDKTESSYKFKLVNYNERRKR